MGSLAFDKSTAWLAVMLGYTRTYLLSSKEEREDRFLEWSYLICRPPITNRTNSQAPFSRIWAIEWLYNPV